MVVEGTVVVLDVVVDVVVTRTATATGACVVGMAFVVTPTAWRWAVGCGVVGDPGGVNDQMPMTNSRGPLTPMAIMGMADIAVRIRLDTPFHVPRLPPVTHRPPRFVRMFIGVPAKEHIQVNLPDGFDPNRHGKALVKLITEQYGEGFEITNIDPVSNVAHATRTVAITEITDSDTDSDTKRVELMKGTKPSDGEKLSVRLADQYPGFEMVKFHPHLHYAELKRLDPGTSRCRVAVAVALGVKPWHVQVSPTSDGGYEIELPDSYVPSKHDDKLEEVATAIVGRLGWWVRADASKRIARIIPGDPPTFPAIAPYDFDRIPAPFDPTDSAWARIPIGLKLPPPGVDEHDVLCTDFEGSAHCQVSGLSGGGKLQPLTSSVPVPVSAKFPTGWATIGELSPGDSVYAVDGTATKVLSLSEIVEEPIIELTFDDGQTVEAGAHHLWTVSPANARHMRAQSMAKLESGQRRESFEQRRDRLVGEASALRGIAMDPRTPSGGTVADIAALAGVTESYAHHIARSAKVPCETVMVATTTVEFIRSVHQVRHYVADDALPIAADVCGVELAETDPTYPAWMTVAAMVDYLGAVVDPADRGRIHGRITARLRQHQIESKLADAVVERRAGRGMRPVRFFPTGEFLLALADAREAVVQPGAVGDRLPLRQVVTTAEIAAGVHRGSPAREEAWWAVDVAAALDGPDIDLPIEPYVLGAWIGDGSSHGAQFTQGTSPSCTDRTGVTDQAYLVSQLESYGYPCSLGPDGKTVNARRLVAKLRSADLLRNKHIPAAYLRASKNQRLALLQGLMDTDGTIARDGGCEFTQCNKRIAISALELIRSLGIKASMTDSDAAITEADPDNPGHKRRRVTSTRYRIHFTTDQPVFRLPRKAERIPTELRETQHWHYVVGARRVSSAPSRCLRIAHPAHLYLTDGFIPTHNSVTLASLISGALARGWELTILDPVKSGVDFIDFEPYCRPGGWGCEDLVEAVCSLTMAYNEGVRRKKLVKEHRVQKWTQLPAELGIRPLLVVSDEVSSLLTTEPVPKLAKDSPLVLEIQGRNLLRSTALNYLGRIARELRFVGVSLVVSSQVSSTTTGVPTEMRTNLGQKILMGTKPTDNNRRLALSAPDAVPEVPDNIADDPSGVAKGVGVYEFEGHTPGVFKGFFAPPTDFAEWLESLDTPTTDRPRPTPAEIARYTPSLDDGGGSGPPMKKQGGGSHGGPPGEGREPSYGNQPSGASVSAAFGSGDICATCGGVVDPLTGNCRCSR